MSRQVNVPPYFSQTRTHNDMGTPIHPLPPTHIPRDPSFFLPLPLALGLGRVCPFLSAGFFADVGQNILVCETTQKSLEVCESWCVCVCVCLCEGVYMCIVASL